MPRLGLSIYPEHSTPERDIAYLEKAATLGFSRVFTCLLSVNEDVDALKDTFAQINQRAHQLGFEVIFDVAPSVFQKLNISYDDLSFFKELHADGIRLDEGFDGQKEAMMTRNPQGLKIEINASQPTKYVDNILSYRPYKDNLITCHNFYPQKYTGLDYALFMETSTAMKAHNLKVAAFVSSQEKNTFGPWPIDEGLCTLEMHRHLPIDLQARHLYATEAVDDILIANAYASDEELERLSSIHPGKLTFRVDFEPAASAVEMDIALNFNHIIRGDMSRYMGRSTMSRIAYASADIPAHDTDPLKRGDIVILNNGYGRYKGELHVILDDMENDGRKNRIGHLNDNEQILLEFVQPWVAFQLLKD